MRNTLLVMLLFLTQFSIGQMFTFTQKFSDDSLGKYGFRTSVFYVSDTASKIWLVDGKDLRGYTKKKVIEWLGKPNKIEASGDTMRMFYYITDSIVEMGLFVENDTVTYVSDILHRYPNIPVNEFSAKFKADSLGKNGYRFNVCNYDSFEKTILINQLLLTGYSRSQLIELLGRPYWVDTLKDKEMTLLEYPTQTNYHISFYIKNDRVIEIKGFYTNLNRIIK